MAEQQQILGVEIAGWGKALPAESLSNEALIARYGLDSNDEWIRSRTGIGNRYLSNPENGAETNAGLSEAAGRLACRMAGIEPDGIDKVFVATVTPDRVTPSAAVHAHARLGMRSGSAMDVDAACAGFVYGLNSAYREFHSGDIDTALVIGTDVLSRIVNWQDRGTAVLFGDGSGAVVLKRTDRESGSLARHEATDSSLIEDLYCDQGDFIAMQGQTVYRNAVRLMTEMGNAVLEKAGVGIDDVALVVPHQANLRIVEAAAARNRLNIPTEKLALYMDRYANNSSASIPIALSDALNEGRVKRGDLILQVGFGAGLTAAGSLERF